MAGYNIAANQRRVSPVQEMLKTQASMDASKINNLNAQRAELEMPYVQKLMDQQVRGNEQQMRATDIEIENAETSQPFLKKSLEQREEAADLQIDMASEAAKKQVRDREFQEAISSQKYTQEQLEAMFPERWVRYATEQMNMQIKALDMTKSHIARIRQSGNPVAMVDAYNQVIASLPEEHRGSFPQVTPENVVGVLADLDYAMDENSNTVFDRYVKSYERYKANGNDEMAAMALKNMEAMASRGSISGTQAERAANELFSWSASPRASYERWKDLKRQIRVARETFVKRGIGLKPTDEMWGQTSLYTLQETAPEQVAQLLQAFDSVAHAGLSKEDLDWYSEAQSRVDKLTAIPGQAPVEQDAPAESAPRASQYEGPNAAILQEAHDAIGKGAPEDAVRKRLEEMGIDHSVLDPD